MDHLNQPTRISFQAESRHNSQLPPDLQLPRFHDK